MENELVCFLHVSLDAHGQPCISDVVSPGDMLESFDPSTDSVIRIELVCFDGQWHVKGSE